MEAAVGEMLDHDVHGKRVTFSKIEQVQEQGTKILFLILGILFTYAVFVLMYGNLAITQILKGLSIQNIIDTIVKINISELLIWLYFIILFGTLYVINRVMKAKLFEKISQWRQTIVSGAYKSFREGSLTVPLIIMVAFPLLIQIILPWLIITVVIVELLLPFVIVGELFNVSKENLAKIIRDNKSMIKTPQSAIGPLIGVIFSYPLIVYILTVTGLGKFLNLLHYNFLWENPDSPIAVTFWNVLNGIISTITFNSNLLISIFQETKYFIVAFIILIPISQLYLYVKQKGKNQSIRALERFILTYQ